MYRRLVLDITEIGYVQCVSDDSTWSSCLNLALNRWIQRDLHIMEFYYSGSNYYLVLDLSSLTRVLGAWEWLLAQYVERDCVLSC